MTIVVTAFMLGLGFGGLAGGWLSKRRTVLRIGPELGMPGIQVAVFGSRCTVPPGKPPARSSLSITVCDE